jgi:hypothetical protein
MSCAHYAFKLEEQDRHYVKSDTDNNCVLCLANRVGPMSYDKIAEYLGYSKMRISQIEKLALAKFKKRSKIDAH